MRNWHHRRRRGLDARIGSARVRTVARAGRPHPLDDDCGREGRPTDSLVADRPTSVPRIDPPRVRAATLVPAVGIRHLVVESAELFTRLALRASFRAVPATLHL